MADYNIKDSRNVNLVASSIDEVLSPNSLAESVIFSDGDSLEFKFRNNKLIKNMPADSVSKLEIVKNEGQNKYFLKIKDSTNKLTVIPVINDLASPDLTIIEATALFLRVFTHSKVDDNLTSFETELKDRNIINAKVFEHVLRLLYEYLRSEGKITEDSSGLVIEAVDIDKLKDYILSIIGEDFEGYTTLCEYINDKVQHFSVDEEAIRDIILGMIGDISFDAASENDIIKLFGNFGDDFTLGDYLSLMDKYDS